MRSRRRQFVLAAYLLQSSTHRLAALPSAARLSFLAGIAHDEIEAWKCAAKRASQWRRRFKSS